MDDYTKEMLTLKEALVLENEPLTDIEAFNMVETDPDKRAQYKIFSELKKHTSDGTLTEEELKYLVDTLFAGQKTDEYFNPDSIYNALLPKIKKEEKTM